GGAEEGAIRGGAAADRRAIGPSQAGADAVGRGPPPPAHGRGAGGPRHAGGEAAAGGAGQGRARRGPDARRRRGPAAAERGGGQALGASNLLASRERQRPECSAPRLTPV